MNTILYYKIKSLIMVKINYFLILFLIFGSFSYAQLAIPKGVLFPPSYPKCKPTMLNSGGDVTRNLFGTDKNYP